MITVKLTRKGTPIAAIAKQLPFAAALAATQTVRDAQLAMQRRMPKAFNLRGTEALFRRAVKTKSATKRDPKANVRIEGPQSGEISTAARVSRMILRHEVGGTFASAATHGKRGQGVGFYLPVRGMRSAHVNVPRRFYPTNIGQALRRSIEGDLVVAADQKGRKRKRGKVGRETSYFTTKTGIYERRHFGKNRSGVRLLWAFERQIRLRPRLGFFDTTRAAIKEHSAANFRDALRYALKTAKP